MGFTGLKYDNIRYWLQDLRLNEIKLLLMGVFVSKDRWVFKVTLVVRKTLKKQRPFFNSRVKVDIKL